MILDLTAPSSWKSLSIKTRAKERLRDLLNFHNSTWLFLREFLENIFPMKKNENWFRTWYPRYGSLTLGALSYLHVGTSLGGSVLKPGTISGHGWVEHSSSQMIQSSNTEVKSCYELLILVYWVCKSRPLKELQSSSMRL